MVCPNCGKKNQEIDKYCGYCGTLLIKKKKYKGKILFFVMIASTIAWAVTAKIGDNEKGYQNFIKKNEQCLEEPEHEKTLKPEVPKVLHNSYRTVDLSVENEEERTRYDYIFSEEYNEQTKEHTVRIKKNEMDRVLAKKIRLGRYIITDGETNFYSTSISNVGTVYRNRNTNEKEEVVLEIKLAEKTFFSLVGFYDEKVFYVKGEEMGLVSPADLYEYDMKSKQHTLIMEDVSLIQQNDHYLYVFPVRGDAVSVSKTNIRVYDIKNGEIRVISEQVFDAGKDVIEACDNEFYYIEWNETDEKMMFMPVKRIKVICCDPNGDNKKTLIEELNTSYITSLNNKRIVYLDEYREEKTWYFQ